MTFTPNRWLGMVLLGVAAGAAWLSLRLGNGPSGKAQSKAEPALEVGAPTWVRLNLSLTATWRRFCARPGVDSCGAYERLPEEEQLGDTSDFSSSLQASSHRRPSARVRPAISLF